MHGGAVTPKKRCMDAGPSRDPGRLTVPGPARITVALCASSGLWDGLRRDRGHRHGRAWSAATRLGALPGRTFWAAAIRLRRSTGRRAQHAAE